MKLNLANNPIIKKRINGLEKVSRKPDTTSFHMVEALAVSLAFLSERVGFFRNRYRPNIASTMPPSTCSKSLWESMNSVMKLRQKPVSRQ